MRRFTFGSLFAGIGGFDLGFERAGFECKWQVEIDEYATKILEKHWPKVHRERDIRECNTSNLERVDCIIGGFPCQDISYAGRGAGLAGERSGLFFEAVRLVRELQPRAVVLENVAALLTRGLDRVLGTLAEVGYDAQWHCIPAAAVGAPHIRDRVFVIAYSVRDSYGIYDSPKQARHTKDSHTCGISCGCVKGKPSDVADANSERFEECQKCNGESETWKQTQQRDDALRLCNDVADTRCELRQERSKCESRGEETSHGNTEANNAKRRGENVSNADIKSMERQREKSLRASEKLRDVSNGRWWAVEPAVGRVANGIPRRVDRLRCLGNAIVPQVAEVVAKMTKEVLEID